MESAGATFYKILGVEPSATFEEIKDVYRKLVVQQHPDKGGNKESFQLIQEAWSVLRDPSLRRKYDAEQLASDIKSFEGIIAAEVPLDDFEYDEVDEVYSYACRCGDFYEIEYEDLLDGVKILACNSCSLLLNVVYDGIVEQDATDELEEEWAKELGMQ